MKVSEIPSNEIVVMTPELYQEFCLGGCIPMCHLTLKPIKMGEKFKLATVDVAIKKGSLNYNETETREVMLAENSSVLMFIKIQEEKIYQEKKRRKEGGGCFRINGQIVP